MSEPACKRLRVEVGVVRVNLLDLPYPVLVSIGQHLSMADRIRLSATNSKAYKLVTPFKILELPTTWLHLRLLVDICIKEWEISSSLTPSVPQLVDCVLQHCTHSHIDSLDLTLYFLDIHDVIKRSFGVTLAPAASDDLAKVVQSLCTFGLSNKVHELFVTLPAGQEYNDIKCISRLSNLKELRFMQNGCPSRNIEQCNVLADTLANLPSMDLLCLRLNPPVPERPRIGWALKCVDRVPKLVVYCSSDELQTLISHPNATNIRSLLVNIDNYGSPRHLPPIDLTRATVQSLLPNCLEFVLNASRFQNGCFYTDAEGRNTVFFGAADMMTSNQSVTILDLPYDTHLTIGQYLTIAEKIELSAANSKAYQLVDPTINIKLPSQISLKFMVQTGLREWNIPASSLATVPELVTCVLRHGTHNHIDDIHLSLDFDSIIDNIRDTCDFELVPLRPEDIGEVMRAFADSDFNSKVLSLQMTFTDSCLPCTPDCFPNLEKLILKGKVEHLDVEGIEAIAEQSLASCSSMVELGFQLWPSYPGALLGIAWACRAMERVPRLRLLCTVDELSSLMSLPDAANIRSIVVQLINRCLTVGPVVDLRRDTILSLLPNCTNFEVSYSDWFQPEGQFSTDDEFGLLEGQQTIKII